MNHPQPDGLTKTNAQTHLRIGHPGSGGIAPHDLLDVVESVGVPRHRTHRFTCGTCLARFAMYPANFIAPANHPSAFTVDGKQASYLIAVFQNSMNARLCP